jgi:hypothetical protein
VYVAWLPIPWHGNFWYCATLFQTKLTFGQFGACTMADTGC